MYSIFAEGIEVIKTAGVYKEESLVENTFRVDIKLTFKEMPQKQADYQILCNIVKTSADEGFVWIESWADRIIEELKTEFSNFKVNLKIKKLNPALKNQLVNLVGVEYEKEF